MWILKRLESETPEELIAEAAKRPGLIYSAPEPFERQSVDGYKACVMAALETLGKRDDFKTANNGKDGYDAHRITKRIFEEQSAFDPYADKAFCDEAARHCFYYVCRYTSPDELPLTTDYTLDQFANCFASGGVLILTKRGCDFSPQDTHLAGSDLGNYRLFVEFPAADGSRIVGDISVCPRWSENRKLISNIALYTNFSTEREGNCFGWQVPGYKEGSYDFTQADVLRLINEVSAVHYDRIATQ